MTDDFSAETKTTNKVLIVEDDPINQRILRALIAQKFDVETCSSGAEALARLESINPQLIMLDIEMKEMDGYATCREIRQSGIKTPIIFVTAHQSLEKHYQAYVAGGDDLIVKPVNKEILLHKIELAIQHKQDTEKLQVQTASLQKMAMNFLTTAGDSSVLVAFVRQAATAQSYFELALCVTHAAQQYNIDCSVMIRQGDQTTVVTSHGEPNNLERLILEKMSYMGRQFQFQQQLIVNYEQVSVMVSNLPTDSSEKCGRIRDNITMLTETAEALCQNVAMRIQSNARAEQMQVAQLNAASSILKLRNNQKTLLMDTRILLQELADNVEATYSWLNTSNSQEAALTACMNQSIQKILLVLATGNQFDDEFSALLKNLESVESGMAVELF